MGSHEAVCTDHALRQMIQEHRYPKSSDLCAAPRYYLTESSEVGGI